MNTILTIHTNLSPAELVRSNARSEIKDFIIELDAEIQEADFTEGLILTLAESLRSDMKTSEMKAIAEKIQAMEGYEP